MSATLEVLGFAMYAGKDEGGAGGFDVRRERRAVKVWAGPFHLILEKVRKPEAIVSLDCDLPFGGRLQFSV